MGSKKGQVTVFIIIGIIALVSVGVFMYMRSVKVEAPITYSPTIEQIPVEAEPIREFVQSCVELTAENGLRVIGDFGGYISKEDMQFNSFIPTEGNAVQFAPDSDLVIPYWWHLDSPNTCFRQDRTTCKFTTERPRLYRAEGGLTIEGQLDEYVNENLKTCLADFSALAGQGFEISEAGPIDTKTVVTQETVAFDVTYPLHARKAGVDYELNKYFTDIPIKLREIYEFATNITNAEIQHNFLERYATRVLSFYMHLEEDSIPPQTGFGNDPGVGKIWIQSDVKDRVKQRLISYMPMLRVPGTKNYQDIEVPATARFPAATNTMYNDLMIVPLVGEDHPSLTVNFLMLDWWDIYFNMNCGGELCKADSGEGFMDFIGSFFMQKYDFSYDYSFPVLVNIVDTDAFFGKGYSFKFFIEANSRHNRPLAEIEGPPVLPPAGEPSPAPTMLCNANKKTEHEFTIRVVDALSGEAVPDAQVDYTCGSATCSVGSTGPEGGFTGKFPLCIGGLLRVKKNDYFSFRAPFSTATPIMQPIDLQMFPLIERDIEIRKIKIIKIGDEWITQTGSSLLSNKEEAALMMTRHPEPGEAEFSAIAEYLGDRSLEDSSKNMTIIPGVYDIDIVLVYRGDVVIPEDYRCEPPEEILGIEISDEVCYTLDEIAFSETKPFYEGGISLQNVTIKASDLANSDKIVFHAIAVDLPNVPQTSRVHEDMQVVNSIPAYTLMYGNTVMPEYESTILATARGTQRTTLG